MTHKLIHTQDYLLVVDDSEIKEGDYVHENISGVYGPIDRDSLVENPQKIIAHLPLNNSPILEGVDLLPPLEQEDDVEKLANSAFTHPDFGKYKVGSIAYYNGYKEGYNKAKEKYKYTEEDMRKAIFLYAGWITGGMPSLKVAKTAEERLEQIFQSLSQPKMPVAFECEEKVSSDSMYVNHVIYETKTITTSKDNTQWVGKYIY